MPRDNDRFKIDPTVVKLNSDSTAMNYGHAISKLFTDLGDIENKKADTELTNTKNKYEEIKLQTIKDEVEDDRNFSNYILADNKDDFLKENPFKTSKYSLLGKDYQNKLTDKEKEEHYKYAVTNFSNEKGEFDRTGAFSHLANKVKDGTINESMLYDITDAIDQKTQSGIYTPKTSVKDKLDMIKTQAEIGKLRAETANVGRSDYAPTSEMKNYKAYAMSMQNAGQTPKAYHEWMDDEKLTKSMGTGIKDMNYANQAIADAINSDDKSKKINAANIYSNTYKDAKEVDKYFRGLAPTTFQLQEAQKLTSKNAAGVTDEIKNQFSTWTGLNWDETTQEGRTAFLSILQPLAKASMTGTASDRDMKTLESSFATLWQSDKAVANALQNKTQQLLFVAEQYQERHPDYVKLTGYDKNINMLKTLVNQKVEETNKPKILFDLTDKKDSTTEKPTNKPSWKDYE